MQFDLQTICDYIILISAVAVAISNIYRFLTRSKRDIKKQVQQTRMEQEQEFNNKVDARVKEVVQPMLDLQARTLTASFEGLLDKYLPKRLLAHDEETRKRYLADRHRYLCEIKEEVVTDLQDKIEAVDIHEEQMNVFTEVLKELLRERIMEIYRRNRQNKMLDDHERHELNQAYRSYKSINGNSYIDDYYAIMERWETVPDNRQ